MRRLLWVALAFAAAALPLAAQGNPPRQAPPAAAPTPPTAPPRTDSLRMRRDSLWSRSMVLQDSLASLFMPGFSLRRVRIGVVVRTRPADTDTIGAFLDAVTPGGPAAGAGLRAGDIITRFGTTPLAAKPGAVAPGTRVPNPGLRLVELVAQLQPNDTVTVDYRRGSARQRAKVVAAADPENLVVVTGEGGNYGFRALPGGEEFWISGPEAAESRAVELALRRSQAGRSAWSGGEPPMPMRWRTRLFDLELAPVNPQLGSYFGTTEGVLVVDLPDSAPLGLKAGDVILTVDSRKVTGPSQFLRVLASYDDDEPIQLEVMRQKKRMSLQGTLGQ